MVDLPDQTPHSWRLAFHFARQIVHLYHSMTQWKIAGIDRQIYQSSIPLLFPLRIVEDFSTAGGIRCPEPPNAHPLE
jgi:hypothetical protein